MCRTEQLYQNSMSLWHQLHMNMKSLVSWHYLQKDISNISSWTLDSVCVLNYIRDCVISEDLSRANNHILLYWCFNRCVFSLRLRGSRLWITWMPILPISFPTATRAHCLCRARDKSSNKMHRTAVNIAKHCCSRWRQVNEWMWCGNGDVTIWPLYSYLLRPK